MPTLRALPPQFLLPNWSNTQLHQLRSTLLGSRVQLKENKGSTRDASGVARRLPDFNSRSSISKSANASFTATGDAQSRQFSKQGFQPPRKRHSSQKAESDSLEDRHSQWHDGARPAPAGPARPLQENSGRPKPSSGLHRDQGAGELRHGLDPLTSNLSERESRGKNRLSRRLGRRDRELLRGNQDTSAGKSASHDALSRPRPPIRKHLFRGDTPTHEFLPRNQTWQYWDNKTPTSSLEEQPPSGKRRSGSTRPSADFFTGREDRNEWEAKTRVIEGDSKVNQEIVKAKTQQINRLSLAEELFPSAEKKAMGISEKLSLLEELFPAESKKHKKALQRSESEDQALGKGNDVPRLDPPILSPLEGDVSHTETAKAERVHDYVEAVLEEDEVREGDVTIMVVMGVSNALSQADFDRVIPHGEHIEEWRGPGEFLKVIPARDTTTLRQLNYYFLLFSNPTYAHAYKTHLTSLHALSRTHTPRSLESPPVPPPGVIVGGANVHQLLQDYTLCPPSADLHIRILFPPLKGGIRRILAANGYPQLTRPTDRAGRAVLLWVEGGGAGQDHSAAGIESFLAKDGQDRGLPWGPLRGDGSIAPVLRSSSSAAGGGAAAAEGRGSSGGSSPEEEGDGLADAPHLSRPLTSGGKAGPKRWIVSFADENEARRFARTWHLRPCPLLAAPNERGQGAGKSPPVVHATYMW